MENWHQFKRERGERETERARERDNKGERERGGDRKTSEI